MKVKTYDFSGINFKKGAYLTERKTDQYSDDGVHVKHYDLYNKWKKRLDIDEQTFQIRLASDNLEQETFYQILKQSKNPELIQPLKWMNTLKEIFNVEEDIELVEEDYTPLSIGEMFKPFYTPFFIWAKARIIQRINKMFSVKSYADEFIDKSQVTSSMLRTIHADLSVTCIKTLIQELHISRVMNELNGDNSEQRFQDFVAKRLSDKSAIYELLHDYPVLARIMVEKMNMSINAYVEALERFLADRPDIIKTFPGDFTRLIAIEAGMGDKHQEGRSVMFFHFRSGDKIVYKPRSLSIDQHYQQLLTWINSKSFTHSLPLTKLINREHYGWQEFVISKPCNHTDELERFYYRQGGYIALLYILQSTDFHLENIIASGEYPVLIDMETLFQNDIVYQKNDTALQAAMDELQKSVFRSSMLPVDYLFEHNEQQIDVSALGAMGRQELPKEVYVLENIGTDQMKLIKKKVKMDKKNNMPVYGGEAIGPGRFTSHILSGFEEMYQIFLRHRDELLAIDGPIQEFHHDSFRAILRSTQSYSFFLDTSFHPDQLQDGLRRVQLFDILWAISLHVPKFKSIIPSECKDLLNNDIPYFTAKVGHRELWDSRDKKFKGFFQESALQLVLKKINRMNESDLHKQQKYIIMSLATLQEDRSIAQTSNNPKYFEGEDPNYSKSLFLDAAKEIGNILVDESIWGASFNDVTWIGIRMNESGKMVVSPLGIGLYDGIFGVILFLAYLGHESGEHKYTHLAQSALRTARALLQSNRLTRSVSAFYGYPSVSYLYSHLSVLWKDDTLLEEAFEYLLEAQSFIQNDRVFDFMGGSAGAALIASQLFEMTKREEALLFARKCGNHLLKHAKRMQKGLAWSISNNQKPFAGLSHGSSGIALALFKLFQLTGDQKYVETALEALSYEQSLYIPRERNWKDIRLEHKHPQHKSSVNWCHGAPGIGLSRLLILSWFQENIVFPIESIEKELDISQQTTMDRGFGDNYCLCHGDLGNLEFLLNVALYKKDFNLLTKVNHAGVKVFRKARKTGWLSGVPSKVQTPGFMLGLAGQGYEMLRLHNHDLPSILSMGFPSHSI